MPLSLEPKERAAAGRIARLETPHGTVTTPTLLPVINPNINLIPAKRMRELFGTEMVITNSYVIRRSEEHREKALSKGVHAVIDWDGPVMTDSGTFQQYVYGDDKIALDPAEVVAFQRDIGVDVGTVLDVFSTPDRDYRQAMADVEETTRRIEEAAGVKGDMALAATIQGGVHPLLREEAAERAGPFGDLFPIGGVVPLMEQQRYAELVRAILAAKRGLPPGAPVHLFGCGHPMVFPLAAALGCDLFDSSAYAKFAREGRVIFPDGTRHLDQLEEWETVSPTTASYQPDELRRMAKVDRERLLAEHNLHVSFAELRRVREAIRQGTLWELVEQRATAHPSLVEALQVLAEEPHKVWLEQYEPVSGPKALFYTGTHTLHRPLLHRLHERLRRDYRPPPDLDSVIIMEEGKKPYTARNRDIIAAHLEKERCHFVVDSHLGPVPIELDEMYPFSQSVVPEHVDGWTRHRLDGLLSVFIDETYSCQVLRAGDELEDWGFHAADDLYADPARLAPVEAKEGPGLAGFRLGHRRMRATADMQFGRGAADALFGAEDESEATRVTFTHSRKTKRIRNVHVSGEHVLSVRATDGLFSLTAAGARRLHAALPAPRLRVAVTADSATFNGTGKNVMTRFVTDMDPRLRIGDDAIIVDPDDRLVAHGRVLIAPHESGAYARGIAVRVREGLLKENA